MPEIVPLLVCLNELLTPTTTRQLRQIVFALLCSPDRITMIGLFLILGSKARLYFPNDAEII